MQGANYSPTSSELQPHRQRSGAPAAADTLHGSARVGGSRDCQYMACKNTLLDDHFTVAYSM